MPRATAVEENTPITVSLARAERRRTRLNSRANTTAKSTAAQVGSLKPQMAPMAMPVKAGAPRHRRKGHPAVNHHGGQHTKQGRDDQHRQQGVFIKYMDPGWAQSKGSRSTSAYQSSISPRPLPHPQMEGLIKLRRGR